MAMTEPRIAVIMPTVGRETLALAKQTIGLAATPWVVRDKTPHDDHGAFVRNHALSQLDRESWCTHVAYLDDDDAYMPNTIDLFRRWAADAPDALHIGRIIGDDGHTVIAWTERVIRKGQVATPTMLAPAWAATRVEWESVYDHDWRWARDVAALVPRVVWHEEVVAMVRPWG